MESRSQWLLGVSALALGIGLAASNVAHADPSCNDATITGAASSVTWTSGDCSITNTGSVTLLSASGSSIGTLTNQGQISGASLVLNNTGTIGAISNAAGASIVSTANTAIVNSGTIGTLSNQGTISGAASGAVFNYGTIGSLRNTGTISGSRAVHNHGTITTLTNEAGGLLTATATAIRNDVGSIGTLVNRGTISGATAVENAVSIGTIDNSGMITGTTAILNAGAIGTIDNSGTISGSALAISTSTDLGAITNSGVIAGDILKTSTSDLTINGGTSSYGTLTGYANGSVGTITNTTSNLSFGTGLLLLNDNINVGSNHTVSNTGARLKLSNAISISGNYSQTGGGLVIVASTSSDYAYLTVGGSATVTNTAITISGSGLTAGETFTIVRPGTSGTYSNDLASVSGTAGLGALVSTSGNDLVVTLYSSSYYTVGQNAGSNAAGMGAALDALVASASVSSDMQSILSSIGSLPSTGGQALAIKELGLAQMPPAALMGFAAANLTSGVVAQHQQTAMAYNPAIGKAAGSDGQRNVLWGQMMGGGATRDGTADADGYRTKQFGFASGVDHMIDDNLMGGMALSWVRGFADASGGSDTSSIFDSYQLTAYGTWRLDRLFVDGQAGVGLNHFHQKRDIDFLNRTATADFDGEQYLFRAQTGYDIPLTGGVLVTPLGGLTFVRGVTDGYTESGAGAANLTVDRNTSDSLAHNLGGQLSSAANTEWGRLTYALRMEWVHDYRQAAITNSGSIDGAAFTTTTPRLKSDGAQIGLAFTLDTSDDLSIRAEYNGEFRENYQSHSGLVKLMRGF